MAGKANHRGFGHVRKLPSKRYQASYIGPDLLRHSGPTTFVTKGDAEAFLAAEHRLISMGEWTEPKARRRVEDSLTFGLFAEAWLAQRDLKPRTRELYQSLLNKQILSTFGSLSLVDITPATVRVWFSSYGNKTPAYRARAYQVLRAIFETAVSDEMIVANPCRVKGGGTHTRVRKVTPATLGEIQALIEAMPARLAVAVPLASFCALRFGEMSELRRKDIDLQAGVLRIRRGVVRVGREGYIVGQPKSAAGIRDVAVPPHLIPMIKSHLNHHVGAGREALILTSPTGDRLGASCLQRPWWKARDKVGRPDLRWHDLRHTGAVLAAQTGATVAELMGRLGHSTPQAAMIYQHAAQGRGTQIAAALSELVTRAGT
jgi:integrase